MTDIDTERVLGNIDVVKESPITKRSLMALKLSSSQLREWIAINRKSVKPWSTFLNTSRFKLPAAIAPAGRRIVKNIDQFQSNYLFVFMGLVIFCVMTSPLLLIAIAAFMGACYIINLKNQEKKLSLMGKELSLVQQYSVAGALSFPVFWLAGAGSAVFWIIGASFFSIICHAGLYKNDSEVDAFAQVTEEV